MAIDHFERFECLMKQLAAKHPHAVLIVSWPMLVSIMASVQLSLRHVRHTGPSAQACRAWLKDTYAVLNRAVPGLGDMMSLGEDPANDLGG